MVIVKTPFHLEAISSLFPDVVNNPHTLVLYGEFVNQSLIKTHKSALKNYNFSQKKIFANPVRHIASLRQSVREIQADISLLMARFQFDNTVIYIGSDKDVYTQILIKRLAVKTKEVIAVDEGLGFYQSTGFKDKWIQMVYGIFTPLVFGVRLYFIKRLGTLPAINTVYLRDIELLSEKRPDIEYRKFNLKAGHRVREITGGKLLFYSFPEQDYLFPSEQKIKKYGELAAYLRDNNRTLHIKPHPRENFQELISGLRKFENVTVLDGKQLGESIDYFEYENILNVFSSIVLDIFANKYPRHRVITLGFSKGLPVNFGVDMRYVCFEEFIPHKILTFEN